VPAWDNPPPRLGRVELFFTVLLIVITGIVAWFTFYVLYGLFKGQS
jgi:hypothetical protein